VTLEILGYKIMAPKFWVNKLVKERKFGCRFYFISNNWL